MKMALSPLEEEKDENDSRYLGGSTPKGTKLNIHSSFEQGGGHSMLKFANLAAS
jgi:hypothetical protein